MKIIDFILETLRVYLSAMAVLFIVSHTKYDGWFHVVALVICFLVVAVKRFFKSAWS